MSHSLPSEILTTSAGKEEARFISAAFSAGSMHKMFHVLTWHDIIWEIISISITHLQRLLKSPSRNQLKGLLSSNQTQLPEEDAQEYVNLWIVSEHIHL